MKITKLILSAVLLLLLTGCKPSESDNTTSNTTTNAPIMTNTPATTNH